MMNASSQVVSNSLCMYHHLTIPTNSPSPPSSTAAMYNIEILKFEPTKLCPSKIHNTSVVVSDANSVESRRDFLQEIPS